MKLNLYFAPTRPRDATRMSHRGTGPESPLRVDVGRIRAPKVTRPCSMDLPECVGYLPMPGAKDLWERVRAAQELLGTGSTEEALERAGLLREEAIRLLNKGALLASFDRGHANAAYAYATVTVILGLAEDRAPAEFVPKVRNLAVEAAKRYRPGTDIWKAVAAAAEVLARAGDSMGAAWAIKKARQLSPNNDELAKVAGGISSMYPKIYAEMPDEPSDEPPETPGMGGPARP